MQQLHVQPVMPAFARGSFRRRATTPTADPAPATGMKPAISTEAAWDARRSAEPSAVLTAVTPVGVESGRAVLSTVVSIGYQYGLSIVSTLRRAQ